MKKIILRVLIVLAILLVAAVIVIGMTLNSAVKKGVETFGPQLTKVSVKLDSVNISILSGSGGVKGMVIGNPEGYKTDHAISVGEAELGLSPGSLLSDKVVVKHIRVVAPDITFESSGVTENNLSKILDNLNAATGGDKPKDSKPAETKSAGPGKKLQVDDFLIKDAKVNVAVPGLAGKTVTVPIPDIHLSNLGQGPEGITAAELTKQVLTLVLAEATKAAASDTVKNLSKQATDAVKDVSKTATDAAKGVTDLFEKKK